MPKGKSHQISILVQSFMRMGLEIFESPINFFENFLENGVVMIT